MAIETKPWDVAEILDSPETIAAYLDAALEENDPVFFSKALGDAARAIGMTKMPAMPALPERHCTRRSASVAIRRSTRCSR